MTYTIYIYYVNISYVTPSLSLSLSDGDHRGPRGGTECRAHRRHRLLPEPFAEPPAQDILLGGALRQQAGREPGQVYPKREPRDRPAQWPPAHRALRREPHAVFPGMLEYY